MSENDHQTHFVKETGEMLETTLEYKNGVIIATTVYGIVVNNIHIDIEWALQKAQQDGLIDYYRTKEEAKNGSNEEWKEDFEFLN